MAAPKLGVQLIVYRGRQNEDLEGVLKEVADVGYAGIEAGNLFDMVGEQPARDALAATGLAVTAMHTGYGDLADEAKVDGHLAYLKAVGSKYLICSGVADREKLEGYTQSGETFNRVGQKCKNEGLVFCYHNHAWEFEQFNGQKGIHALCAASDPDLVKLCVDVYWVKRGGEKPEEFIDRYQDRAVYFHFKDGFDGPKFIELGQGDVDLPAARDAALKVNPEWIVCEQDRSELEPKQSIQVSFDYLKQIGL